MLTAKEKKALIRIEKNLAMPRWKYLLIYGVSFGLLLAIISSVIDIELREIPVATVLRTSLWINLAAIPVTGFLFAKIIHWLSVKQYLKLKRKEAMDNRQ